MAANSARTTLLCGSLSVAMGGFYVLEALGVVGARVAGGADNRAVGACAGAMFVAGGAAAMLTTVPGARARAAIEGLSLVILAGFAAITGWISIGPGERNFGGSFVIFGPHINEIVGRIAFGFSALVCLAAAMAAAHVLGRSIRPAAGRPGQ